MANPSEDCNCGCMDFRLRNDSFTDRNAGGTVSGIKFPGGLKRVEVTVHRDCGGIKAAALIIDGKNLGLSPEAAELFEQNFVKYFREGNFQGAVKKDGSFDPAVLKMMEEFNLHLQERLVDEKLSSSVGRIPRIVTLAEVPSGLHADTVTVLVGKSPVKDSELARTVGSEIGKTYIIRADDKNGVLPSLELSVLLMGKKDIRLVAASEANRASIETLRKLPFMPADVKMHVLSRTKVR